MRALFSCHSWGETEGVWIVHLVLSNDERMFVKVHSSAEGGRRKANKRETCPVWSSTCSYSLFKLGGKLAAYVNLARSGAPSPSQHPSCAARSPLPSFSPSRTHFSICVGHDLAQGGTSLSTSCSWPSSSIAQELYLVMLPSQGLFAILLPCVVYFLFKDYQLSPCFQADGR